MLYKKTVLATRLMRWKLLREVDEGCSVSVMMKYDTSVCVYECKTLPWQLKCCTKHQSWPQYSSVGNCGKKLTRDVLFQLRLKYDTSVCVYECKTLSWQLKCCTKHQCRPQDLATSQPALRQALLEKI